MDSNCVWSRVRVRIFPQSSLVSHFSAVLPSPVRAGHACDAVRHIGYCLRFYTGFYMASQYALVVFIFSPVRRLSGDMQARIDAVYSFARAFACLVFVWNLHKRARNVAKHFKTRSQSPPKFELWAIQWQLPFLLGFLSGNNTLVIINVSIFQLLTSKVLHLVPRDEKWTCNRCYDFRLPREWHSGLNRWHFSSWFKFSTHLQCKYQFCSGTRWHSSLLAWTSDNVYRFTNCI